MHVQGVEVTFKDQVLTLPQRPRHSGTRGALSVGTRDKPVRDFSPSHVLTLCARLTLHSTCDLPYRCFWKSERDVFRSRDTVGRSLGVSRLVRLVLPTGVRVNGRGHKSVPVAVADDLDIGIKLARPFQTLGDT